MSQNRAPGGIKSRFYMSDEEKANQPKVTKALPERILSCFKPYTGKLLLLLTIAVASFLTLFPSILTGKIIDEGLVKRDLAGPAKYILLSLAVMLFTLPTRRAGKTRWKYASKSQACNDEINGILNETLSVSGQLLSKLFCREKYEYGDEAGPTANSLYEKYGSWQTVLEKALGTNEGMDACLGPYDEY